MTNFAEIQRDFIYDEGMKSHTQDSGDSLLECTFKLHKKSGRTTDIQLKI